MPEVADAFRRFAGSYVAAHGAAMLPSHRRAIADIIACRTEALGGPQWSGNHGAPLLPCFPPCRNRACPKCHAEQTQAWLEQRREEMLPVPYFHVTVTVPKELRAALRRYQIDGYEKPSRSSRSAASRSMCSAAQSANNPSTSMAWGAFSCSPETSPLSIARSELSEPAGAGRLGAARRAR